MDRLRGLGRGGRLLLALAVGGALFGIANVVQADIPDSGVIHGCYGKAGTTYKGQLRVRDASQGEQCRFYENPVDWSVSGVSGATGATGPTGPTGPTGSQGPGLPAVTGAVDVDAPSVPASSCITQVITIASREAGDRVLINPSGNLSVGLVVIPTWSINPGTTQALRICNVTGAALDPPGGLWAFVLFRAP